MAVLPFDVWFRDHGAKAGLKGLSKEAQEAARRQDEFRAKATVAGAAVGAALFKLGKDAVAVASDISESQSKVQVVFGKSSGEVSKFAQTSAKSMGISKAAYLEAAGTLGNLFVSLKLPQGEAAKMSTRMIALASDMASFNNSTPEEALEALRSGLVGEAEPLRRFGVNLNDATLRQKALELGLVKTTKDALDPAVKAQATYALVLEQTKTAQGDFTRTSTGLANSQRILKAEFSDMQGELGEKLLPAAVKVTGAMIELIDFLDAHGKSVGIVAGSLAAVAAAVVTVNKASAAFKATSAAWDTVTTAMASFSKEGGKGKAALSGIGSFMTGPWGAAMLVGGGALALYAKKQADARQRVEDLTKSLDEQTGALTALSREHIYTALKDSGAISSARRLGISLKDLTDAAEGNAEAQARVSTALDAVRASMGSTAGVTVKGATSNDVYRTSIDRVEEAIGGSNKEIEQSKQEWANQKEAQVGAAGAIDDTTGALGDNTAALDDNVDKLTEREGLLNERSAAREYEEAVDDLTTALKENGKTHDNSTAKGRANNEALDRLAEAAVGYKKAIQEAGTGTKEANRIQADAKQKLVAAAIAMGYERGEAVKLTNKILGIPKKADTKASVQTAQAKRVIRELQGQIDRLHGKSVIVGAEVKFPSGWAQYRAGERSSTGRAAGGAIGDGTGTVDDVPILAMRGEHMWTTREVQAAGGHAAVKRIRNAALSGQLQGYAKGGPIGSVTTPAGVRRGVGRMESILEDAAVQWGRYLQKQLDPFIGAGSLGGSGWRSQWAAVHRAFPWAQLTSAYRPGAITASGNRSYHSMGRAIDVSPSMDIFRWIARNYGARTKELIFSTAGTDQIKNGRKHWYGEPVRSMHWNHVHWAYDQGGLASGRGWMAKATSAPERVLSPRQTQSFENLVRVLDRGGAGPTVNVTAVFPNYLGDRNDLRSALRDLGQSGELDRYIGRR